MREKIFAVDLGSKFLKICVGEEDESGRITILTKLNKNIDSFNDGEIIDQENFLNEVIETIKNVAYEINEKPRNLILSFSSSYFNFQRTKGKISVSEKYITDEDIHRSILIAKASLASGSYEILFEQPISYLLDNLNLKVRDPLGMEARSLEVDFLVIQGLKSTLNKIKDFFLKNDLKISLFLPNPLPASFIVLPKKEKEIGVILIDFGYKIFNISIFEEGKLIFYQNLKFGLGDILEDLSIDFGINIDEILDFLREIENSEDKKKKVKIKIKKQKYSYSQIVKLIEKKISFYWKKNNLNEIFKKIKENFRLPAGIYLIGGGSYLPEIENFLRRHSGYSVRKGNDINKTLNEDERIYLNSLGLIFYYQKTSLTKGFFENIADFFKNLFR